MYSEWNDIYFKLNSVAIKKLKKNVLIVATRLKNCKHTVFQIV